MRAVSRILARSAIAAIPAVVAAFLASWAIWWFWYDIPPPQIQVPLCHSGADLYVRAFAVKAVTTEYHCFDTIEAQDVRDRERASQATPGPFTNQPDLP